MGTVTGIGDLDAKRWPGSKWRNLEVHMHRRFRYGGEFITILAK
jgi:hypothetical protein